MLHILVLVLMIPICSTYVADCDLYHGKWVHDTTGPLYTNNSCPVLTQMQNCQGNGRPDKDYENWRWKPSQCELPRFDPRKFLELMRGKTLAFIGDSVARNQMESMLCILWQVKEHFLASNLRTYFSLLLLSSFASLPFHLQIIFFGDEIVLLVHYWVNSFLILKCLYGGMLK